MSSKVEIKCDFCGVRIISEGLNDDHRGYCAVSIGGKKLFTDELLKNLNGPHICYRCIEKLALSEGFKKIR